jgi:SRSO17 transposase
VQDELKARPELLSGGVLLVDESADEKASGQSAGAAKQHNGRMGKVETSQVGVLLSYVNLKVGVVVSFRKNCTLSPLFLQNPAFSIR